MMKKLLMVGLLVGILCVGVVDTSIQASTDDSTFEEVWKEYENDEQFRMMYEDYGEEYAIEFIENVIANSKLGAQLRGGGGNECYQYVTNVKQTADYNCGSTTVLQTAYGLGCAGNIPGNTNAKKIATIDGDFHVQAQGSLFVYQVADALNAYKPSGIASYTFVKGSNLTEIQFEGYIATSLTNCKPVVLHAKTKYLSYYNGKNTGHYLSLDYVNRTTRMVRIVDCNYDSTYYGIHRNVPVSEAYQTISEESERYLIY